MEKVRRRGEGANKGRRRRERKKERGKKQAPPRLDF
jgi:hypothetical protein